MSHYSTLQDYQFDADVKDIRGAALYGENQKKIGKIKDVVFDHDNGNIRYLVADMGHDRLLMLPLSRVYRTAVDEDAFETDLSSSELEHLPAFDDKVFASDESWKSYEQQHRDSLKQRKKAAEREEKKHWENGPVMHMEGSDHIITPPDIPAETSTVTTTSSERSVPASELYPDRIQPKFTNTDARGENLTLVPEESARIQEAAYGTETLGPHWEAFEDSVRENLGKIKTRCGVCETHRRSVA